MSVIKKQTQQTKDVPVEHRGKESAMLAIPMMSMRSGRTLQGVRSLPFSMSLTPISLI